MLLMGKLPQTPFWCITSLVLPQHVSVCRRYQLLLKLPRTRVSAAAFSTRAKQHHRNRHSRRSIKEIHVTAPAPPEVGFWSRLASWLSPSSKSTSFNPVIVEVRRHRALHGDNGLHKRNAKAQSADERDEADFSVSRKRKTSTDYRPTPSSLDEFGDLSRNRHLTSHLTDTDISNERSISSYAKDDWQERGRSGSSQAEDSSSGKLLKRIFFALFYCYLFVQLMGQAVKMKQTPRKSSETGNKIIASFHHNVVYPAIGDHQLCFMYEEYVAHKAGVVLYGLINKFGERRLVIIYHYLAGAKGKTSQIDWIAMVDPWSEGPSEDFMYCLDSTEEKPKMNRTKHLSHPDFFMVERIAQNIRERHPIFNASFEGDSPLKYVNTRAGEIPTVVKKGNETIVADMVIGIDDEREGEDRL